MRLAVEDGRLTMEGNVRHREGVNCLLPIPPTAWGRLPFAPTGTNNHSPLPALTPALSQRERVSVSLPRHLLGGELPFAHSANRLGAIAIRPYGDASPFAPTRPHPGPLPEGEGVRLLVR